MKAELIIENGQARLLKPVYLKPDAPRRFEIEIPEETLAETRDWFSHDSSEPVTDSVKPEAHPGSLQEELNTLLGPLACVRPGASIGEDHQTLFESLEDRYVGR